MFENQMLLVLLLFAVALIAGYFYLKRAQRRDATKTDAAAPSRSHEAAAQPAARPAATEEPTHHSVASEGSRDDVPRSEAPRSEAPRSEAPRSEAPRSEAPRSEAPPPRE